MFSQILLIGGSDSSGLAGVQADKTICQHYSVTGHIVTTSVTIQDANRFYSRFDQDANFVADSIRYILENQRIDYVKIGMLANLQIVEIIFDIFKNSQAKLIIDPVFKSTSGSQLLDEDAIVFLKSKILPICYVLTPNIGEAELLTGMKITSLACMTEAARKIRDLGTKNVIIKGGHLDNDGYATDILYDEAGEIYVEQIQRVNKNVRGSGCRFATSLACNLSLKKSLSESFLISKKLITSLYSKAEMIENRKESF